MLKDFLQVSLNKGEKFGKSVFLNNFIFFPSTFP